MTVDSSYIQRLEEELNSFDIDTRAEALCSLSALICDKEIQLLTEKPEVNLHYHTFFSYNAEGWSPSRIAWETRKYGLAVAGVVDFDVLDAMEEFLSAGELLNLRSTAAMETRVFIREYGQYVMSSPNEPGIAYFMAGGCYRLPDPESDAGKTLQWMRDLARNRNLQMLDRVNDYLGTVRLDYDADVLPLTPSGNATERHMLAAYDEKSRKVFAGDETGLASFWAQALEISNDEAAALLGDTPKFHEKIRSKLMKYGGVGYVAPTEETFPVIDTVIDMIHDMDGIPMIAWLDGTNPGEADMPAFLGMLESKGVMAMNIIPDRNWNIKNPEEKKIKVDNLDKAVKAARALHFPIVVGTEMNKGGLPFVDDFSAPELKPYTEDFLAGAYIFWGHTFLARNAGMGYTGDWAAANFGDNRERKNSFYKQVGEIVQPARFAGKLSKDNLHSCSPADIIALLHG